MQVKPKPCKSTKTKDFGCGELSDKRILGVCPKCYPKWLYSTNEGLEKVSKATIPIVKKRKEYEDAAKDITDRKKVAYLLANTKTPLHEYVRLRDKGLPCISCGGLWQSDHEAGHFYKAELYSTLRFDEKNISGQCKQCNQRRDGNESGYRVGIINRYGKEHLEYLDNLASTDKQGTHKWDRQDLEAIRTTFKNKLKQLKND